MVAVSTTACGAPTLRSSSLQRQHPWYLRPRQSKQPTQRCHEGSRTAGVPEGPEKRLPHPWRSACSWSQVAGLCACSVPWRIWPRSSRRARHALSLEHTVSTRASWAPACGVPTVAPRQGRPPVRCTLGTTSTATPCQRALITHLRSKRARCFPHVLAAQGAVQHHGQPHLQLSLRHAPHDLRRTSQTSEQRMLAVRHGCALSRTSISMRTSYESAFQSARGWRTP